MRPPRIQIALALAAALLTMPAAAALADEADDQFAVAAGHYAARRWELAAEEFQRFLAGDRQHVKRIKAMFFCGEALMQAGRYTEAQALFTAVLEAEKGSRGEDTAAPRDTAAPTGTRYSRQALFRAGECAFWAEKPDEAKASLAKFRMQYADDALNAYALDYLGEMALKAGDAAAAKAHYLYALNRFPDGPTADDCRLGLAQSHLRLKEHEEAKSLLATLVNEGRLKVEANYWLGQGYKAQQQWDLAVEAFQAAIAANPEHRGVPTLRYQAAETLLRAEKYQAAIDVIQDGAQDQNADRPKAAHGYVIALAEQGLGRHEQALATLDSLATESSQELRRNVLFAKVTSLVALGRHGEAIEPLNELLAAPDESDAGNRVPALAQLALSHAHNRDFERATTAHQQLAERAPGGELLAGTTLRLAQIAVAAKETALARSWFEAAAGEQTPAEIAADALRGLAQMSVDAGELETAATWYERLLQRYPDGPDAAEAALACGRLRERLEQHDAALAMYNLVLERHANAAQLPQAILRAANLYDRLSQEASAIELYARLAREFPDSPLVPAAQYGWAWCLRDLKRDDEANEKFAQLRREFPECEFWADATYRLALVAAQAKQFEQALELLGELIDAANSDENGRAPSRASESSQTNLSPAPNSDAAAVRVSDETLRHALYLRAQIAMNQAKWDDASRDLERLMRAHGASPVALAAEFLRADVAYRRGNFAEAGTRFAELAPKLKGRDDPWIPMAPLRQAQVLAQQKRWSEARAVAEQIAKDYPEFGQQYEADYLIGRAFAADANLEKARLWYQTVVRSPRGGKTETAAMAQWMIGETYLLQEKYAAAVREYLRVEVLYAYPHWQAAALLQAGKCYEQLGQWKEAGDAYRRLLARYSQTEFATEARQRQGSVQARTASRAKR